MKTIIKCEDQTLTVSNENFDSDNWFNLTIKDIDDKEVGSVDVSLDELMCACIQFDALRSKQVSLDNQRKGIEE